MESIADWLETQPPWLVSLVLAGTAALEYLFPPAPGDAFALFGVVLASRAAMHPLVVHLSLTAGSVVGALGAYALGVRLGPEAPRLPRWLGGERSRQRIAQVLTAFERRGAVYLAVNRFLPSLRAFFFVAAGMRRMPLRQVVLWGGLSAALWNGVLLALGLGLNANWETLQRWLSGYAAVVLSALVLGAALWLALKILAERSEP